MLTADAFGVLPPIARLTPDQAMYHFLSGYTAKVAGTEIGVTEPKATFSTCFGAPFMPRHPSVYGNLLKERIAKGGVDCWLVNTGWTGGKYGVGKRMPIKETRALLNAALDGSLNERRVPQGPEFRLRGAGRGAGRRHAICSIRAAPGPNPAEYDAMAAKLVDLFVENFAQFADHVDEGVRQAAPTAAQQQAQPSAEPSHARLTARSPIGPFPRTRSMTEYPTPTVHLRRRDRASRRRPSRAHPAARGMDPRSASRRDDLSAAAPARHRPRHASCPGIIRRYNESVGGVNSDTEGYHETITRVFLHGVRLFLSGSRPGGAAARAGQRAPAARRWAGATGRCAFIRASGCSRSRRGAISSRRTWRHSRECVRASEGCR